MLRQACSQEKSPESATCVQSLDDSWNPAIHITYRTSLRSSSLREPRDPLLKVVFVFIIVILSFLFRARRKKKTGKNKTFSVCY
jgi:hypothetical protein